ncbi:LCP family protein [Candidatus Dojkabacteria bacterium]|uniref:LCP family protein n=1 Tax=Candidatus Dojkabacteria bacterium TaxID=2099670 RepID=A0A955IAA1_9BACT|nr:LCP family protein [Candidatus Dojkabacteria bacterium]
MLGRKLFSLRNRVKRNKTTKNKKNISSGYVISGIFFTILLAFIALVSPVITAMVKFEPKTNYPNLDVEKWDYNEKFKVLLVGLDKKSEEHVFVDAVALLVVDPSYDQVGIININPDILVNTPLNQSQTPLRRGLMDLDEGNVVQLAEELLATKIDRYLYVDSIYFEEMSKFTKTIYVENFNEVEDVDVYAEDSSSRWQKGRHSVQSAQIVNYIKSDSDGEDKQLERQLELYKRYVQSIDLVKVALGTQEALNILQDNISTNLSRNEIYYLYYYLRSIPPSSYNYAVTKSDILSEVGRTGVYNVFRVNEAQLDYQTNSILENKQTVLEQTTIEILNASGQSGKARQFSRWVGNAGLEVIHVGNAPFASEDTVIYAPNPNEYPNSFQNLKEIFGLDAKIVEEEYDYRHIGKIVVIIGDS